MTKPEEQQRKPLEKIYKDPRHKDGWIKESEIINQRQFDEYARKWWIRRGLLYEDGCSFDEGTTGTAIREDI